MVNAFNLRYSVSKFKMFLYFLFICGWIFPKINIGPYNLGFQEIIAFSLFLVNFRIDKGIFAIFRADILFSMALSFAGLSYFVYNNDLEGLLIGLRTLLFVFASIGISSLSLEKMLMLLKSIIFFIFIFCLFSVTRILLNFYVNSFDIINFFYGSDSYRVRAPFENGGASSQVPIGYMLAILLSVPSYLLSKTKMITLILGALGTTSRASLLSIVLIYGKKLNFKKFNSIIIASILSLLILAFFLKSFLQGENYQIDGSANKRLELYSNSINLLYNHPKSFFIGFGLSTNSLILTTGEGFYESFLINSFMQGGILLFIFALWIIIKTMYFDYKYGFFSISIAVLIGNLVGGSNYFSMYAYPLMVLIISFGYKKNILIYD